MTVIGFPHPLLLSFSDEFFKGCNNSVPFVSSTTEGGEHSQNTRTTGSPSWWARIHQFYAPWRALNMRQRHEDAEPMLTVGGMAMLCQCFEASVSTGVLALSDPTEGRLNERSDVLHSTKQELTTTVSLLLTSQRFHSLFPWLPYCRGRLFYLFDSWDCDYSLCVLCCYLCCVAFQLKFGLNCRLLHPTAPPSSCQWRVPSVPEQPFSQIAGSRFLLSASRLRTLI